MKCFLIKTLFFVICFLCPAVTYSSPPYDLQNNHLRGNDFLKDNEENVYLKGHDGNLYFKSNLFTDAWGLKANNIETLSIDPEDKDTIYAIKNQRIKKTNDGGKTWTIIEDGLPSVSNVTWVEARLFINPHNNKEIYLYSFWYGLFKSSDSGLNWNETSIGKGVQQFIINPNNKSIFYALIDSAPYITKDAGKSWERMDGALPTKTIKSQGRTAEKKPVHVDYFLYVNQKDPYILAFSEEGEARGTIKTRIFKTDNNGGKWVEVSNILKELDDSVLLDNNAILVISKSTGKVHRSTDAVKWESFDFRKNAKLDYSFPTGVYSKNDGSLILYCGAGAMEGFLMNLKLNEVSASSNANNAPLPDVFDNQSLYNIPNKNKINASEISPDGRYLAIGDSKGLVIYETQTWQEVFSKEYYPGIYAVAFSSDGNYLAAGSEKRTYILDGSNWKELTNIVHTTSSVYGINTIVFSPDSKYLLTGDGYGYGKGTLRIYNIGSWEKIAEKTFPASYVNRITFSPNGHYLALRNRGTNAIGKIFVLKVGSWDEIYNVEDNQFEFSNDGKYLISGSWQNGKVRVFETDTWKELDPIGFDKKIYSLDLSGDGKYVAAGDDHGFFIRRFGAYPYGIRKNFMELYVASIRQNPYSASKDPVNYISFANDMNYLITYNDDGQIMKFIDVENWNEIFRVSNYNLRTYNNKWLIGNNKNSLLIFDLSQIAIYSLIKNFKHVGAESYFKEALSISAQIETDFKMKVSAAEEVKNREVDLISSTKKDEFETENEYRIRMSNREAKINEINENYKKELWRIRLERTSLRNQFLEKYEAEINRFLEATRKPINLSFSIKEYKADIETFPIAIMENDTEFFSASVMIPRDKARYFKEDLIKLQMSGEIVFDKAGRQKLENVTITNPETGDIYNVLLPVMNISVLKSGLI